MAAHPAGAPNKKFKKKNSNKAFWSHFKHFGRIAGKMYLFHTPSKTDGRVPSQQGAPTTWKLTYREVSQQTYVQTKQLFWVFGLPENQTIPYDVVVIYVTSLSYTDKFTDHIAWIHSCMWNLLAMKTNPLLFLIRFIFKYVILVRLIFELETAPQRNTINLSARTGTLNLTGLVSQRNKSVRKQRRKEVSKLPREVLNLMAYTRRCRPKGVPFSVRSRPWDKTGGLQKQFFWPFRPQFQSKNKGKLAPPWICHYLFQASGIWKGIGISRVDAWKLRKWNFHLGL